jgi:hypothetical protein
MKRISAVLVLAYITLFFAVFSFTQQGFAVIDEESLAGFWLFDEGSGEVVVDGSGNGNDGTVVGDPKWVKGKFGQALEFDGVNDLVDTSYMVDDQNAAWTVMCWVELSGPSPHPNHRLLVGRSNGVPQLWVANTGKGQAQHKTSNGFQESPGTTDIPEQWTHIAGTFDGSTIRVYVNGVEEGSLKPVGAPVANVWPLQIGGFDETLHGGGWSGCWTNGTIDEVALFNAVLTVDDIKSIMQNGIGVAILAVSPAGRLADTWGRIKSSD